MVEALDSGVVPADVLAGPPCAMGALGVVELQRTRERLQHGLGGPAGVAPEPGTRRAPAPKLRNPACSGGSRARRDVRKSRISLFASTVASVPPTGGR